MVTYRFKFLPLNPLNAELNPISHLLVLLAHPILYISKIRVNLKCWQMANDIELVHIQEVQPFVWQTLQTVSVHEYENGKIQQNPWPRALKDWIYKSYVLHLNNALIAFSLYLISSNKTCHCAVAHNIHILQSTVFWDVMPCGLVRYVLPFQRSLLLPFSLAIIYPNGEGSMFLWNFTTYLQDYMLSILIRNENRISISHIFF